MIFQLFRTKSIIFIFEQNSKYSLSNVFDSNFLAHPKTDTSPQIKIIFKRWTIWLKSSTLHLQIDFRSFWLLVHYKVLFFFYSFYNDVYWWRNNKSFKNKQWSISIWVQKFLNLFQVQLTLLNKYAISDYNHRIITLFLLSFISHSLYVQDTAWFNPNSLLHRTNLGNGTAYTWLITISVIPLSGTYCIM